MKGKSKIYHANEQEVVSAAVNEEIVPEAETVDVVPETDPDCHEELVEIDGYVDKESIDDVTLAPNLTVVQKTEFMNCADQFSRLLTEVPGTPNLIEHHINLTTEDPVRNKSYPLPYSMREELKDIDDMIKMRVARESTSPYSLPVVAVKRKGNTNWVCVDYQKLNKLTVLDPQPMPTAGDMFHKLSGDKYFSRIDLSKGYWQINVPRRLTTSEPIHMIIEWVLY